MRFAIGVEYDGSAYNGWQRQENGRGVQECLELALATVAAEDVLVQGAGRTDTGVHARGQVAHFDTHKTRSERGWLLGANTNLPDDVSVTWIRPVPPDFHARFTALERRYRYVILNRLVRPALERQRVWWIYAPLDADSMHNAAQSLLGTHDFSAFRAAGCQAASPQRTLRSVSVTRDGDYIVLDVEADGFLQRMVRNIVGTLVAIGTGERSTGWIADVLTSRDRKQGGIAAPAHGLTLMAVRYPDQFGLPPYEAVALPGHLS